MNSPPIRLEDIGVQFRGMPVLSGLSLAVPAGTSAGIVGPNGSGKTTLIRVTATLTSPSEGSAEVMGARLGTSDVYAIRPRIGLLSHQPALYGELTLRENLQFVARVTRRPMSRVEWALDVVGLSRAAGRRADESSWGMQRRAEFARLFLTEPDVVCLDEPQAGLDEPAGELVGTLVSEVRSRKGAVLVASHRTETLLGVTDVIYELSGGSLSLPKVVPA